MMSARHALIVLLLAAVAAVAAPRAVATSISTSPLSARLLGDGKRFIVQDSPASLACYRVDDGQLLARFDAAPFVGEFDVSADDRLLVATCGNGGLSAWSLPTGMLLWSKSEAESGLGYAYDISLARDGRTLVASAYAGFVMVLASSTGELVRKLDVRPGSTLVMSACLAPDGRRGWLVELGGRLIAFDVGAGTLHDTGLTGAAPVRCSSDGLYLAMRSSNDGRSERLRLVAIKTMTAQDLGSFVTVGHVRGTNDGSFQVTARVGFPYDPGAAGFRVVPTGASVSETWRLPGAVRDAWRADFDAGDAVGIATDFELETRVIDLKAGRALLTLGGHRTSGPVMTRPATPPPLMVVAGVIAACLLLAFAWRAAPFLAGVPARGRRTDGGGRETDRS